MLQPDLTVPPPPLLPTLRPALLPALLLALRLALRPALLPPPRRPAAAVTAGRPLRATAVCSLPLLS